jgi:DNA-binding GntR family transcriptional regulator
VVSSDGVFGKAADAELIFRLTDLDEAFHRELYRASGNRIVVSYRSGRNANSLEPYSSHNVQSDKLEKPQADPGRTPSDPRCDSG